MTATNDAAIAVAADEAVTRATIVANAITNRAIPAMNRRASARIIQVAGNNPVSPKASADSKAAAGDVGVVVAGGVGIAMTAEVRNQKASKAAARFNRTL